MIATPATRPAPLEPTTPEMRPAPVETVTTIRPSEAIRLGCLIAPAQGMGSFFPEPGQACALGAMALGFGYDGPLDSEYDPYWFVEARLPRGTIPMRGYDDELSYSDAIYLLNDAREWSRERIADCLEGLGL